MKRRLSDDQVFIARCAYVSGRISGKKIAEAFGVRHLTMYQLLQMKTYANSPAPKGYAEFLRTRSFNSGDTKGGKTKLSWEQVDEIRKSSGESDSRLAKKYGVSRATVSLVRRGITWKEHSRE